MSGQDAGVDESPASLADSATALAWWALQFTPKVCWARGWAGVLVMEVSGSERLFGGRRALLERMRSTQAPPVPIHMAQGSSSLIAIARLQPISRSARTADDLNLSTLASAQPHLTALATLGCTRWGQLRALPRGGVTRRFGAVLMDELDRAYGQQPETYPWLVLPEVFEARLELTHRVDNAPALMFGARRLLAQLQLWLQLRQRGVLAFSLRWDQSRADRQESPQQPSSVDIRTATPSQVGVHLQRLLAERLAHVQLSAPVEWLTLRSLETAVLPGTSASLRFEEGSKAESGDSLHHLLERLSVRLGAHAVRSPVAQSDHRPEHMQVWLPANELDRAFTRPSPSGAVSAPSSLYPTWLLPEPLKLACGPQGPHYQGPLTLLAGPHRLEAAWWVDESQSVTLRDYFIARTPQALCVWIYRERLKAGQGPDHDHESAEWFLHGLFA